MSLPRFHVPSAAPGARLTLPEHSAHHLREVLRLRAGAAVRVFDGNGHEFEAILESVSRQGVGLKLGGPVAPRPESPLRLVLACSALKGDRMELVIQKATELGVLEVWPVITARTDAVARPALHGSRQERWEKVASAASEQCGRATVPRIAPAATLQEVAANRFDGRRIFFLEHPGQPPLKALGPLGPAVLALIGPAGGFEDAEIALLLAAGFGAASLGPRRLRSETAAVAAVTALQTLFGDLA